MTSRVPPPQWNWIAVAFVATVGPPLAFYLPDLVASPWLLIQDDGRHFVAWLRGLDDPGLFPGDPIAQMFGTLTPALYKALYYPAVMAGIDVVRWHMLVVIPLSVLLFLWSADRFIVVFLSEPAQRAVVLLCLAITYFNLYGVGLPRSFGPAIVLLAIGAFATERRWLLAAVMALGTNMYPAAAMTAGGGLACAEALRLAAERRIDSRAAMTLAIAAGSGLVGLLVFLASAADLGPTMTAAEARALPIFQPGGRAAYFTGNTLFQVSCGSRARLLQLCGRGELWWIGYPLTLLVVVGGILLLRRRRTAAWRLLAGLCLSGLILFAIATVIAFKAHLPARYSFHSIGLVFNVVLFLGLAACAGALARWRRSYALAPALTALGVLVAVTGYAGYRGKDMISDGYPALSAALRTLPADTLVAGTSSYLDNVPAFAARPVYAALQLVVPYKRNYYREMEARTATLATLYGATDRAEWLAAHERSGIDVYVVSTGGTGNAWTRSFPVAPQPGTQTIFAENGPATARCTIASERELSLVDAACFEAALRE